MEIHEAIQVIRALANGVDPETGAALKEESICRVATCVKALNRALSALVSQQDREQNKAAKAGAYWTHTEDVQVCEELRQGMEFKEIAKTHNRTVPSIVARLIKLGKVTPEKSRPLFPDKVA
jgi:hypothetical protein